MPVELFIDGRVGVVFTKLTGTLRREELWDHRKQIQAHPDFRTNLQQWIDMRELTVVALSAEDIARFAGSTVFNQGSRRAILVASDLQYGLGRMFETYAPGNFQLFREAQEACSFLGIPTEPPPEAFVTRVESRDE